MIILEGKVDPDSAQELLENLKTAVRKDIG
jgi:hypothetical protein